MRKGIGHVGQLMISEQAAAYVYVDVWDQGEGISEQHHDLVFERMYTLEDSRNIFFQGSGLGLTITKRLVEQSGGEIHPIVNLLKRRSLPYNFHELHIDYRGQQRS